MRFLWDFELSGNSDQAGPTCNCRYTYFTPTQFTKLFLCLCSCLAMLQRACYSRNLRDSLSFGHVFLWLGVFRVFPGNHSVLIAFCNYKIRKNQLNKICFEFSWNDCTHNSQPWKTQILTRKLYLRQLRQASSLRRHSLFCRT